MKKNSVYSLKLSGWQIDIIESALENTLGDDFFSCQDSIIAESLCENIKSDAEEIKNE